MPLTLWPLCAVRVCCAQALLLPTTFKFPVLTTVGKDVVSSGRSPVPANYPALSSVGGLLQINFPGSPTRVIDCFPELVHVFGSFVINAGQFAAVK